MQDSSEESDNGSAMESPHLEEEIIDFTFFLIFDDSWDFDLTKVGKFSMELGLIKGFR